MAWSRWASPRGGRRGHQRRPDEEVAIDEHRVILLGLGQGEDLAARCARLDRAAPGRCRGSRDPGAPRTAAATSTPRSNRSTRRERRLDLRREPLRRHQRPREGRAQRDLLVGSLGRCRSGASTASMSWVRPAVSRYQPCASSTMSSGLCELVELFQVALRQPERPGDAQVRDVGDQVGERCLATAPGQVGEQSARPFCVVGGVRPSSLQLELRVAGPAGRPRTPGSVSSIATRGSPPGASTRRTRLFSTSPASPSRTSTATPSTTAQASAMTASIAFTSITPRTRPAARTGVARRAAGAIAPIHRRSQGLLSLGQVARPAAQQPQPVVQPVPQDLRGEESQVRSGELDGQRQAVEPPADLDHGRGVVVGEREVGAHHARAIDEQLDRLELTDGVGRDLAPVRRQAERRDRVHLFGPDAQRLAAGGQDGQARALGQQPATVLAASVTCSRLSSTSSIRRSRRRSMSSSSSGRSMISPSPMARAIATRTARVSLASGRSTKETPSAERGCQVFRLPDGEGRLAGAPWPGQGQQPYRVRRQGGRGSAASSDAATDDPGGPGRQVHRGRTRRQRRELRWQAVDA